MTARCPVIMYRRGIPVRCPTTLQRTVNGPLSEGVIEHLTKIHGMSEAMAKLATADLIKGAK